MLPMAPPPAATMAGIWARIPRKTASRLTSSTLRQSSRLTSATGTDAPPMPALLTAIRNGPSRPASVTIADATDSSVTSPAKATATPPSAVIRSATARACSSTRSTTSTEAPEAASTSATEAPIPEPAPVTIAERSATS
jgi:hypothetical protein